MTDESPMRAPPSPDPVTPNGQHENGGIAHPHPAPPTAPVTFGGDVRFGRVLRVGTSAGGFLSDFVLGAEQVWGRRVRLSGASRVAGPVSVVHCRLDHGTRSRRRARVAGDS